MTKMPFRKTLIKVVLCAISDSLNHDRQPIALETRKESKNCLRLTCYSTCE